MFRIELVIRISPYPAQSVSVDTCCRFNHRSCYLCAALANKVNAEKIILFSPFISLPEAAKASDLGFLHPFVRHKLPVKQYLSQLKNSCIILAHGEKDNIVPFFHSQKIIESLDSSNQVFFLQSSTAKHNDILMKIYPQLDTKLGQCPDG